jgi:hypothetical protein
MKTTRTEREREERAGAGPIIVAQLLPSDWLPMKMEEKENH